MEENTEDTREPWRVKLGALSVLRRKQISEEMPINNATLSRWITGERSPQNDQTVRKLAQAAPELAPDLKDAFPDAFDTEGLQMPLANVLKYVSDLALISKHLSIYTLTNEECDDLVSLLDPAEEGLIILPFFCVADDKGQVTHLQSSEGYGTGDWRLQQSICPFDLGGDSLCGFAIKRLRPALYPYQHELVKGTPTLYSERIKSALALPLLRRGECAGALLVGSIHPDFFTKSRQELCDWYAKFYALALYDHQFYNPSQITLK